MWKLTLLPPYRETTRLTGTAGDPVDHPGIWGGLRAVEAILGEQLRTEFR